MGQELAYEQRRKTKNHRANHRGGGAPCLILSASTATPKLSTATKVMLPLVLTTRFLGETSRHRGAPATARSTPASAAVRTASRSAYQGKGKTRAGGSDDRTIIKTGTTRKIAEWRAAGRNTSNHDGRCSRGLRGHEPTCISVRAGQILSRQKCNARIEARKPAHDNI